MTGFAIITRELWGYGGYLVVTERIRTLTFRAFSEGCWEQNCSGINGGRRWGILSNYNQRQMCKDESKIIINPELQLEASIRSFVMIKPGGINAHGNMVLFGL
jgi:hypothetical protein